MAFGESARIREIVQQLRAQREASLIRNGHAFAMTAAASGLGPVISINHRLTGMVGLLALRRIEQDLEDDARLRSFCDDLAAELTRRNRGLN